MKHGIIPNFTTVFLIIINIVIFYVIVYNCTEIGNKPGVILCQAEASEGAKEQNPLETTERPEVLPKTELLPRPENAEMPQKTDKGEVLGRPENVPRLDSVEITPVTPKPELIPKPEVAPKVPVLPRG